jgi:hypothetical protein
VPDAVLVVELALGDRVVDVDRRDEQLAGGRQPQADGGFSWEKTDLVDALKSAF